jgi:hypothetical protein
MDYRRIVTIGSLCLMLYIGSYALLYLPNAVTFRVGRGEPVAVYRIYPRWFDLDAFFWPVERAHYALFPERHKHLANGLVHYVAAGKIRPEWWKRRW